MAQLPESVASAWEDRDGPIILATVSADGVPNAIYATCTARYGDDKVVVANNFFSKTMANIEGGARGSLLFKTSEGKSFQLKGTFEYHTSGPIFDAMKTWNPERLPGHGAAAIVVDEIYSGSERLL